MEILVMALHPYHPSSLPPPPPSLPTTTPPLSSPLNAPSSFLVGTIPVELGEKTEDMAATISEPIRKLITEVTTKAVTEAITEMTEVLAVTLTKVITEMTSKAVTEAIMIALSKTNTVTNVITKENSTKLGENNKKVDETRHKTSTQSEKVIEESRDVGNEGWTEVVRKKKHRTIKTFPREKVRNPYLNEQYKILKAQRKCFRCLKTGHILSACTNVKRCLKCNEPGQTYSRCKKQQSSWYRVEATWITVHIRQE